MGLRPFVTVFRQLPKRTKAILIAQSIGMLMGTSTHVAWAVQNGFLSEHYNAPLFTMLFWDALTFLDPLAALLLFLRPKIGILLVAGIITADVLHNNLFYMEELYLQPIALSEWLTRYWMILGQVAFAVFVWATLRANLKAINGLRSSH